VNDEPRSQSSSLSIKTLLIAGATSAITALVVPLFWEPGTVFAAAMTPIIAAVATELVRRPVDTVEAVTVKKKRTAGGAVIYEQPEEFDPLAPAPTEELQALPTTTTSRAVHRRRGLTPRQWKVALATGLIAFAGVVALLTVSELVAGDPVSSRSGGTTFFGGSQRDRDRDAEATPTPSATEAPEQRREEATPAPTATSTPSPSATPTPAATPTPQATVAPQLAPPEEPTPTP
jgi:hypothetical protein